MKIPSRGGWAMGSSLLLAVLAGCTNRVGITCPPSQPGCLGDAAAPADLSAAVDLRPQEDLALTDQGPSPDSGPPCNAATCPAGCCGKDGCQALTPSSCGGEPGAQCAACDALRANTCYFHKESLTGCACGLGPPCEPGQICYAGSDGVRVCKCNGLSCPNGCCNENKLCVMPSLASCGTGGAACVTCGIEANACGADGCRCGNEAACEPGQACVDTAGGLGGPECKCTPTSCPTGCCNGLGECVPPSLSACGTLGATCIDCGIRADVCSAEGGCLCGSGPICGQGQHCKAGLCVCDGVACPGCCINNLCQPGLSTSQCGKDGNACQMCPAGFACVGQKCVLQ